MIKKIESSMIWDGRVCGTTWFHPCVTIVPGKQDSIALMTCQPLYAGGGDLFGQVHWSVSRDNGVTWSKPEGIPSLERRQLAGGLEEGFCDVVPEYHSMTDSVLALGHNVYYKNNKLYTELSAENSRYIVYFVRDREGRWYERQKLEWDNPSATKIYSCGCSQRTTLKNGDVIVPVTFAPVGRKDRAVGSILCSFDGQHMKIIKSGNELRLPIGRGLLEPNITRLDKKFFMTIRAEDDHGYVSTSEDGLDWKKKQPWCWDDGEPLTMSTTQQHWLTRHDSLFLIYTKKTEENVNVYRWRAPLYVAQVGMDSLCLLRDTERIVLPMLGDGINDPDNVGRMGNFYVVNVSASESWVTTTESLPLGRTWLARIHWVSPNKHF